MERNSKSGIISLILFTISMYVPHLFFWGAIALMRFGESNETNDSIIGILLIMGVVFTFVAMFIGLLGLAFGVFNSARDCADPTTTTMVCKFLLIPWYVANFLFWLILMAGFCNPWLLLGVPLIIVLGVCITWTFVVLGSAHNLAYVWREVRMRRMDVSSMLILAIVFHFIFVFDIVGAIMLREIVRKQQIQVF